jgi:dihydroorotate dehydrogenase electron transfer subunit
VSSSGGHSATAQDAQNRPVQVRGAAVVSVESVGAYWRLAIDAPRIADQARPGQFVALAVGEEPTATLLRRAFSLHRAGGGAASGIGTAGGGAASGIGAAGEGRIEIVVAAHGVGSTWVTRRRPGDIVDVVGPLGRPFPTPRDGARVVLVGGGYGSSPLPWFAEELLGAGSEVDVVVGAATADRLFGVAESAKVVGAERVHVTTGDGTAGAQGLVTDALRPLLAGPADPRVEVYGCGPMAMLRAVTAVAVEHGAVAWCAVEEAMACGVGVCMTCVLPVRHADGVTRMTRSCTEGPTFAGDAVRWDHVCAGPGGRGSLVPQDCLGAPKPHGGH